MAQNWQDPAFAEAWDARGSGLVAEMVLDRFPSLTLFGLDSSTAMLGLAKDRLVRNGERLRLAEGDLPSLDRVDAPTGRI